MPFAAEVAEFSKLREGRPEAVFPLGLPVLLVRLGAEVFALENRCAHMGCPLAAGRLTGHVLQCPCHEWRFDVRDGRSVDAPELALKTYPVEIAGERVSVRLQ